MKILNNEDNSGPDLKGESNRERIVRILNHWEGTDENKRIQNEVMNVVKTNIPQTSFKQMASFFTQYTYLFGRYFDQLVIFI